MNGTPSDQQLDIAWSLRPVLHSMRIFGVDLNVGRPPSTLRRMVSSVLVILGSIPIISLMFLGLRAEWKFEKLKTSDNWFRLILANLWCVVTLLVQLVVQPTVLFKWRPVWNQMVKVEQFVKFPLSSYRQLRRVSLTLTTLVFVIVNTGTKQIHFKYPIENISISFNRS